MGSLKSNIPVTDVINHMVSTNVTRKAAKLAIELEKVVNRIHQGPIDLRKISRKADKIAKDNLFGDDFWEFTDNSFLYYDNPTIKLIFHAKALKNLKKRQRLYHDLKELCNFINKETVFNVFYGDRDESFMIWENNDSNDEFVSYSITLW